MHDSTTDLEDRDQAVRLEEAASLLLKLHGVFRRGTGVRGPRSEAEARRGTVAWDPWVEPRLDEQGTAGMGHLVAVLAEAAQLTAEQQVVLGLEMEGHSYREIHRLVRLTIWRIRQIRAAAHRKCRRAGPEGLCCARALFWEEVARKRASIYRAPLHWRRPGRRTPRDNGS